MSVSNQDDQSKQDMNMVFNLCRKDEWRVVLDYVLADPSMALTEIVMDNHIKTTIIHQAITSKGEIPDRALVIQTVLNQTPQAASIKNGYGSLPLHVICQRNTKMNSQVKEVLIYALINAFPQALNEEGGVGRRTPLHIAFTDYISPRLAQYMINKGKDAALLRDKKYWLPVHVACSRHCSPEKLKMLLQANPSSLHAKTGDRKSLMDLAKETATKSHPNLALIEELERQIEDYKGTVSMETSPECSELFPSQFFNSDVATPRPTRLSKKRKSRGEPQDVAGLLLHFSKSAKSPTIDRSARYTAVSTPGTQHITPLPQGSAPFFSNIEPDGSYSFYQPQRSIDTRIDVGDEFHGQVAHI